MILGLMPRAAINPGLTNPGRCHWKRFSQAVCQGRRVGNAYACLDETQVLPSDIGPGEQVTGTVVLDLPTTDGTLILEEMMTGQAWEWDIPAA